MIRTASGTVANGHGAARWYPREVRVHGADSPNLWVTPECNVAEHGLVISDNDDGTFNINWSGPSAKYVHYGEWMTLVAGANYTVGVDKAIAPTYTESTGAALFVNVEGSSGAYGTDVVFGYGDTLEQAFTVMGSGRVRICYADNEFQTHADNVRGYLRKTGGSGQSVVTVTVDGEETEVDTGGATLGSGEHLSIKRDGRVLLVDSDGGEERVGTCLLPMLSPDFSVSATGTTGSLVVDVDYDVEDARGGFHVGRTHSLYDMGALIASRKTGVPAKKPVTKTVPHMSGFYDFSALCGSVAYESREQTYGIDVIGDDRADAQERRSELLTWLSTIHDADIWDDDVVGRHLHGSFSGAEWEESEDGEGGTLTATFLCQPFLVADAETSETLVAGDHVIRNSGQTAQLTASATSGTASVSVNGTATQAVSTTPVRLASRLVPGDNEVSVSGGTVRLAWHETRL